MNSGDRSVITENVYFLLNNTVKTREFISSVKKSNILQPNSVDALLQEGLKEVFLAFTKRGPFAYNVLISCLRQTGNDLAAQFLTVNKSPALTPVPEESYKMKSTPLGLALIVNFDFLDTYVPKKERKGSYKDEENLVQLLKKLNYQVTIRRNLNKKELIQEVQDFRNLKEHSDCDSCVVFIMSHGTSRAELQGVDVECSDGNYVHSSRIVMEFSASKCKALVGKPKVFFFQACRGESRVFRTPISNPSSQCCSVDDEIENGIHDIRIEEANGHGSGEDNISSVCEDAPTPFRNPEYEDYNSKNIVEQFTVGDTSDMLVVYPCHPGKISLRDPALGAWLIQDICTIFAENYLNWDLFRMLREVMRVMGKRSDDVLGSQLLHYENYNFNKLLYFRRS